MASPEKVVLHAECKDGVLTVQLKHVHRGVVRELTVPGVSSTGDFKLDIQDCAALLPPARVEPKTVKPTPEPVTEPKQDGPDSDWPAPAQGGETRTIKKKTSRKAD